MFTKNDNKSLGYILFKNTTLEMEDDRVLCIKYKGKKVAESVGEELILNFDQNEKFKKLLKLAARESLINFEMKSQRRIMRKYSNNSYES